jgi:chaperonin GroEL
MDLKRGIDKAVQAIDWQQNNQKLWGTDSDKSNASISANNDDSWWFNSYCFRKVGKEGVITVEEAKGTDTM